jgi:hypothetical protein
MSVISAELAPLCVGMVPLFWPAENVRGHGEFQSATDRRAFLPKNECNPHANYRGGWRFRSRLSPVSKSGPRESSRARLLVTARALQYRRGVTAPGEPRVGLPAVHTSIDKEASMRKYISTFVAGIMLCGAGVIMTGCTDESGVKTDTTIKAPDGSQTRETREIKVEKKGDNAPAAPSEKK